jgi:hypothetical protein
MGDTITSGRWTIDYAARILARDTAVSATTVDTVRQLYSDLQDEFDAPGQMDDIVPVSAQTPTEFTVGDPLGRDVETPWFISPQHVKYLKGGALQTAQWGRVATTENGIVRVSHTGGVNPVDSDIGKAIVHETDADSGVLVGFDNTANVLWIRPDSNAAANNFDSTSGNLDVTGGTQNIVQDAASDTGEYLWANPNSVNVLSVQTGTRPYVYQNGSKITDWPAGIGLNADGEFDILLLVKEFDVEIDNGVALFFARRGGALGDWFESDMTAGGRVTIPLTGNPDTTNDGVGHHNATWSSGSAGTLQVGEIVDLDSDSEVAAIVVNHSDTGGDATGNFDFVLIRGLTQFSNTDAVTAVTSTKTMVLATPTDLNPVNDTDITFTHGQFTRDISNGNGAQPYSIDVDPATKTWERVYQRGKYITRRGSTAQIDGVNGESYRGSTLQLEYDTQTGNFTEGLVVTGGTSSATGLIVADHDDGADGDLILRAVRGTFTDGETITDTSTGSAAVNGAPRVIPTLKFAPLGNMAGTLWQGAPGMAPVIANIATGREKDYTLVDDDGVVQNPPNTVTISVTGIAVDDWVSVFRLDSAGGPITKNEYTSPGTGNNVGDIDLDVGAAVSAENPSSGWARVVHATGLEDRYHYASKSGQILTFTTQADWHVVGSTATGGDSATVLIDSTADFQGTPAVLPGMLVRNVTDGSIATVKTVDSGTQLTMEGAGLTGGTDNTFQSGDDYRINELVRTYDGTDTIYVPFLDDRATGTSMSTTMVQSATIEVSVRVRQGPGQAADDKILPFQAGNQIVATGLTQVAQRTVDSIAL